MNENSVAGKKIKVYVAGPYTKGDVVINVRHAILVGNKLREMGFTPYIPHLSCFWHMVVPHKQIDFWYDYDFEWLAVCDAVFRFPGESVGADNAFAWAKVHGIPVYSSFAEISKLIRK